MIGRRAIAGENRGCALSWLDVALYLAATCAFTWPLILDPGGRLWAPVGPGDPFLNLWSLGWNLGTISADPLGILTGRAFQANIFHPAELSLAYSDHLILQSLAVWPLHALGASAVACYNVVLFGSLAGSALAMHLMVIELTGSRWGARVSAIAWAFWPYRFAHLLHLQLQSLYLLPLAVLFLARLVAGQRKRDAVGLGVAAGLQAASSVYYGVIGSVALVVSAIVLVVTVGTRRVGCVAGRLAIATVIGSVVAAPFLWPYWRVQQREGFGRNLYEASRHEASLSSYVRVPPGNLLYGRTGILRPGGDVPPQNEGPERELFPGAVIMALAVFGGIRGWRRDSRPLVVAAASVGLAGAVLSLGPDGIRPLYASLHSALFGFQAIRAPARFGVLVMFGLVLLAAIGMRELISHPDVPAAMAAASGARVWRWRWRQAWPVAVLLALMLEYVTAPLPGVLAPPASTPPGQWIARASEPGAVLYLPLAVDADNTVAMVESLEHRRQIVNGYSGQRPAIFAALVDRLNQFPSPAALWALRDLDVRFVVAQATTTGAEPGIPPASGAPGPTPVVERFRSGTTRVYELRWTPEIEARLPRPEMPAPPEPGSLPFDVGEEAVYRVRWLGAVESVRLAAGEARLTAERLTPVDQSKSRYRFTLVVETAQWVSRFFEARDRFSTETDAALFPTRHVQEIREGHRRLDRTVAFDHDQRRTRVGDVLLPMERWARDALSALYYVRTLPLAPHASWQIPIVDNGRNLVLDLAVADAETIEIDGRGMEAWRVEPHVSAPTERRQPIRAVVWLSRDSRRVPLRFEISAGFGDFRVDLASIRSR